MPRCPRELYELVCSSNAGALEDVVIVGNSFEEYRGGLGGWRGGPRVGEEDRWGEWSVMWWRKEGGENEQQEEEEEKERRQT